MELILCELVKLDVNLRGETSAETCLPNCRRATTVRQRIPFRSPTIAVATLQRTYQLVEDPSLLKQLGVSLLVPTYQAGKLVLLRADGDQLNTHFRDLTRPMGLAADRGRLAVGTAWAPEMGS